MIDELCTILSPSGFEDELREYIKGRIADKFDEIRTDNIGNLICQKGNGGLCIECGMDSCGIMIVAVEDDKAYFAGVGGINAEYLIGKKVLFKDGKLGIVRYDGKTPAESKISDLYLEGDTGAISVGDFGVVKSGYCQAGDKMYANGLSSKIGVAVVLEALKRAKTFENLCVVFSAQKRLGSRGIQAFFGENEYNRVLTVDAAACDKGIKSGEGCVVVVSDKAGVCNPDFRQWLEDAACKNGARHIAAVTGEDMCMGHIITSGMGADCAAVAIPVFRKDRNFEGVKKTDFDDAVEFITAVINEL